MAHQNFEFKLTHKQLPRVHYVDVWAPSTKAAFKAVNEKYAAAFEIQLLFITAEKRYAGITVD